jgi:hypothetical protein
LDERLVGFVEEHDFFVGMGFEELIFKVGVKFGGDFDLRFIFCCEDCLECDVGYFFVGLGLFGALFR